MQGFDSKPAIVGRMLFSKMVAPILHEKAFKLKKSGNEVYHTNSSKLPVNNMLCSKLHFQRGVNPILFSYEIERVVQVSRSFIDRLCTFCWRRYPHVYFVGRGIHTCGQSVDMNSSTVCPHVSRPGGNPGANGWFL